MNAHIVAIELLHLTRTNKGNQNDPRGVQNKKVILALKTNLMGLQSYFKWSASVKSFYT